MMGPWRGIGEGAALVAVEGPRLKRLWIEGLATVPEGSPGKAIGEGAQLKWSPQHFGVASTMG